MGDALACVLFNVALAKVIQHSGIETTGTIFYKSVQLLALIGLDWIGFSILDSGGS